jgi:hypothetical protein
MTTTSYLLTREQFQSFRTSFKEKSKLRILTPRDMLIYSMIRGLPVDRGFSPVTNETKLANGAAPWAALETTKASLKWSIKRHPDSFNASFENTLSPEQIAKLMEML